MRIGELASCSRISRDALRYYEKSGLIRAVGRGENRYREYPEETVARLAFIKKMQSLGFTLRGVRELLDLAEGATPKCGAVGPQIKGKMRELDRKIEALSQIRDELGSFFSDCIDSNARTVCTPLARLMPK